MSSVLRVLLALSAVITFIVIAKKLKATELEIADSVFWLFFTLLLVLFAMFPQIAYFFSRLFGFDSPSNFIFLSVIAVLVIRLFMLNSKMALLQSKLIALTQEVALRDNKRDSFNYNWGDDGGISTEE